MTKDIPKFKGSPRELEVEIEGMMLRLTDLINRADNYEDLEDVDVGVWFLCGQALAILGQAKQLLRGDDPEAVALAWTELMEKEHPELAAAHKAVALLNSMILSGEDHSDQSRKIVADVLKTEEADDSESVQD